MARLLLLLPLLLIALLIAAAALMFHHFGLLGLAPALVLLIFGLWGAHTLGTKMVRRAVISAMRAKGNVLRGASAEVHNITPAPAPDPDYFSQQEDEYRGDLEYEQEDDESLEDDETPVPFDPSLFVWRHLDVTIRPAAAAPSGAISHWSPWELILIETDTAPPSIEDPSAVVEQRHGFVLSVEVWRDGAFQADQQRVFEGPRRVRLRIGAPPAMRKARFCYYFEVFGSVELPPSDA